MGIPFFPEEETGSVTAKDTWPVFLQPGSCCIPLSDPMEGKARDDLSSSCPFCTGFSVSLMKCGGVAPTCGAELKLGL